MHRENLGEDREDSSGVTVVMTPPPGEGNLGGGKDMTCSNSEFNRKHEAVQMRPQFEGPEKPLCALCWKDYQDMIYIMWQGKVG